MRPGLYLYVVSMLLLMAVGVPSVNAQHPVFYQINQEDGLPSNEVYRIVQDEVGFIWIGCDAGLYRYDGFKFKQYSNTRQNGNSISFLQLDNKQRVWCKNFYGQIYRTNGDSLKIIYSKKTSDASDPQFTIDNKNNLWVYNSDKIIQYTEDGDSIKSYLIEKGNADIDALQYFNNCIYGILSNLQVFKIDPTTQSLNMIGNPASSGTKCKILSMAESKGELFILIDLTSINTKKNKIYKLGNKGLTEYFDLGEWNEAERIYSIHYSGEQLWYTTSEGARLVGNKYANQPNEFRLFRDKKISSMIKDREGMHWFATLQDGLMVVPELEVIELNPTNSELPEKAVTYVYPINNEKILLGLYTGQVYEYDRSHFSLKEVYANDQKRFVAVKKICRYENYTIISRGRLCIVDNKTGVQYFPPVSNIRDFELINDTLYMVLPTIIAKQSIKNLTSSKPGSWIEMRNEGGRDIEYSMQFGVLYIATGSGTYKVLPSNKWIEITNKGNKVYANALSFRTSILWISTVADGLYGYIHAYDTPVLKYHFHQKNLLADNSGGTIHTPLNSSHIWLSGDRSLYNINYEKNTVSVYNYCQSIPAGDINHINSADGTIFLATAKGMVFFPEKLNDLNSTPPHIFLENVIVDGDTVQSPQKLELKYSNKNIRIDFNSVALKSRGSFTYQYRLNGLDSNWISISSGNSFLNFTRLPAGKYKLEIISLNESGVKSAPLIIDIHVAQPFWSQFWFYFVSIILVGFVVALFYNSRIKYIKRKAEIRNQLTASQLTALKSQMNPHFLFNTLNSLQDLILKHDIKNSNYYLGKYSSLMRMVLNVSGKDEITITEEIEMLDTYLQLEKLRFGEEFTYTIDIDPKIDADHIKIPPMLLQPFIENAIKHGLLHKKGSKEISIQLSLNPNLVCVITDNGVGRKKSEEINSRHRDKHQSFATGATQKRIELLNSFGNNKFKFNIEDLMNGEQPIGTRVVIHLAK